MHDPVVKIYAWGEETSTYVPINIKAGSWLKIHGQIMSNGEGYEIEFTLENGMKKSISMTYGVRTLALTFFVQKKDKIM